jgi:hypothetical protein
MFYLVFLLHVGHALERELSVDLQETPVPAHAQEDAPAIPDPDDEPVLGPRGRLILIICFTLASLLLVTGMITLLAVLAYRTPPGGG